MPGKGLIVKTIAISHSMDRAPHDQFGAGIARLHGCHNSATGCSVHSIQIACPCRQSINDRVSYTFDSSSPLRSMTSAAILPVSVLSNGRLNDRYKVTTLPAFVDDERFTGNSLALPPLEQEFLQSPQF